MRFVVPSVIYFGLSVGCASRVACVLHQNCFCGSSLRRGLQRKASSSRYLRSGDASGHSTLLLGPRPGETIQIVMDEFYTTFADDLASRRDPAHAFLKFTAQQQHWLAQKLRIVKPVLQPGDLLLWLSGVPHCSHADGGHRVPRRGLFITANLRIHADKNALRERWVNVQMGKLGTHNCRSGSGMSTPATQCVWRSYDDDPVIQSMGGGEVGADEFAIAFDAFSASVKR